MFSWIINKVGSLIVEAVYETQRQHTTQIGVLARTVRRLSKEVEETKNMQTANEKAIMDAANAMTQAATAMNQTTSAVTQIIAKYNDLKEQTGQGEDIADEVRSLGQAQVLMNSAVSAMNDAANAANNAVNPPVETPPIVATPIDPQPTIPLAGQTGVTDAPEPSMPVDPAAPIEPVEQTVADGEPMTGNVQENDGPQTGTADNQDVQPETTEDAPNSDSTGVLLEGFEGDASAPVTTPNSETNQVVEPDNTGLTTPEPNISSSDSTTTPNSDENKSEVW